MLTEEHNQKNYWLCPKTLIYALETTDTILRTCADCKKTVKGGHKQGKDNKCPSADGIVHGLHTTFTAWNIHGVQEVFEILLEKTPLNPRDILQVAQFYEQKRMATLAENEKAWMLVLSMNAIFKTSDPRLKLLPNLPWGIGLCIKLSLIHI